MKILLCYLCEREDRGDYFISMLPQGMLTMASYLEMKGHTVILANHSRDGYKKAAENISKHRPDIIGISVFTYNRNVSIKLAELVKSRDKKIKIALGGYHATFLADEFARHYPFIDYIIRGEGELAMAMLADSLAKGIHPERIIEGERLIDLDEIPFPGKMTGTIHGVNPNEQFKFLITSRGCHHSCGYCSSPGYWGRRVTFRSPENMLDEIRFLHEKYGIIYFSIRDDNFTMNRKRLMKFTSLLKKSGIYIMWNCQSRVDSVDEEMLIEMKRVGLEHIQYGVESGSERMLKLYDKNISIENILKAAAATRRAGVYLSIYLMSGMTGETRSDVNKTVSLIKKIFPGDGIVSPVAYYPGTPLYESAKNQGLVSGDLWFKSKLRGIFARTDQDAASWMRLLLNELGVIRERSWYRAEDFARHREICGASCWVTDILEGEFWYDCEKFSKAEKLYLRVIESLPKNVWGYMRMGKLKFTSGAFAESAEFFSSVTKIVPAYYGGWLKMSEALLASGDRAGASKAAERAFALNQHEPRIIYIRRILKGRI